MKVQCDLLHLCGNTRSIFGRARAAVPLQKPGQGKFEEEEYQGGLSGGNDQWWDWSRFGLGEGAGFGSCFEFYYQRDDSQRNGEDRVHYVLTHQTYQNENYVQQSGMGMRLNAGTALSCAGRSS